MWNTKVFTHLRVCIYYFLASLSVVRVSHDDEAQPLSLFFQENGVAGVYGVTTVQWLPRMLYLHIEHVGELPYIYEYMSEWLSVACNFMSIFYKKWKTSAAVSTGRLKPNFASCVIRSFIHAHWAAFSYLYQYFEVSIRWWLVVFVVDRLCVGKSPKQGIPMVSQPFIDSLRTWYMVDFGCGLPVSCWHLLCIVGFVFHLPHPPKGISYEHTHHTRFLRWRASLNNEMLVVASSFSFRPPAFNKMCS